MRLLRLFTAAKYSILRTIPLMRDARVPAALKVATGIGALLVISPIDVFGDVPFLGALDDAALLTMLCVAFVHYAGRYVEPIPVRRNTGSALATSRPR
ncbi:MAG: DUF1232 domain-containing protein [Candidatus Eremiobacteraeota bacterium]|nr:DUF1232 domain-containing protein [Candidatus Eremiobacteraeota bacterium]